MICDGNVFSVDSKWSSIWMDGTDVYPTYSCWYSLLLFLPLRAINPNACQSIFWWRKIEFIHVVIFHCKSNANICDFLRLRTENEFWICALSSFVVRFKTSYGWMHLDTHLNIHPALLLFVYERQRHSGMTTRDKSISNRVPKTKIINDFNFDYMQYITLQLSQCTTPSTLLNTAPLAPIVLALAVVMYVRQKVHLTRHRQIDNSIIITFYSTYKTK